jgi:hypothetical protein
LKCLPGEEEDGSAVGAGGIDRMLKSTHLPFDRLMALSKAEGLRSPHPSSLRRTVMYVSLLGMSGAVSGCF